jgi:hypothetical protein
MEERMIRSVLVGAVVSILLLMTPVTHAQTTTLVQGTQIKLNLLGGLSTSVARPGDLFEAEVAEPVYYNSMLVLPVGAKIHGTIGTVIRPEHFAIFRGQAQMNLMFKSIEIDGRVFPAQLSILTISNGGAEGSKPRKDLKTGEGAVVKEKRDVKGAVMDAAIGTGGGTVAGVIFSHVLRGTVLGLIGGTAYVVQKKGKDVELPAQTQFLVRMDGNVSLPMVTPNGTAANGAQ